MPLHLGTNNSANKSSELKEWWDIEQTSVDVDKMIHGN